MLQNVCCDRARHAAHVIEGEILGDDASPTVGTEFYGSSHLLVVSRWSSVIGKIGLFLPTTKDKRPMAFYTNLSNCFSSRYFTILPTSCACSRVVIRSASSVSTITRSFTPTAAPNLCGE